MNRLVLVSLQIGVALIALLAWHLSTTIPMSDGKPLVPPFFFSTPLDVIARIVKWFAEGTIWRHLWITLTEATLAFVIGSVAGILVGFWFARQPLIAAIFDPYVKMINALPRIVLAPIFTLCSGSASGRRSHSG
jgi:NitT/TauT family transport system permease protein